MKKRFPNAKDEGLHGQAGVNAAPEVREAHLNTKIEAFENLAATAESLGLTHHVNRIQRNSATMGRRLNRMREQHGNETSPTQTTVSPSELKAPSPELSAPVRILMPGIGEKINVVA